MPHSHPHGHKAHDSSPLPLSVMAQSAGVRILVALAAIVVLWLAIWWAAARP